MAIPLVIVEEHNEAFFVWADAWERGVLQSGGSNTLLHVDEHSDLGMPRLRARGLRDLAHDLASLRAYAYRELSIGNFIYPTVYLGVFDEMCWVWHREAQADRLVHLYSEGGKDDCLKMAQDIRKAGVFNPDRRHVLVRRQPIDGDIRPAESLVLDIDLDYFSCTHAPFGFKIAVTEEEYARFCHDPYHLLRLNWGNLCEAIREGGQPYFQSIRAPVLPGDSARVADDVVQQRVDRLVTVLGERGIRPRLVTVCRSRHSGYTPGEQCEFIEATLLQRLRGLYDLDVRHVRNLD